MVKATEQVRRTVNYQATDGRDAGKTFLITEMTASLGEEWATRALLALMASNVDVPDDFQSLGAAGLAQMGLKAFSSLKWEVLKPLLEIMFEHVRFMPDPKKPAMHRELIEEDIQEVSTRLKLRVEIWKLNLGFLKAVIPSHWFERIQEVKAAEKGSNIQTSPES